MYENLEPLPNHAFQKWEEAQNALDHAIQNFLESTIALQSCLFSGAHPVEASIVRESLAKTWLDNPPILDKHSQLVQAQSHLNQIRNSFLSINALPLEILLNIFRFASFRTFHSQHNTPIPFTYQQDNYRDSLVLTHVCSSWRTTLLRMPSFWSRFLLDPRYPLAGETERAWVYSQRAHGAPQSLSIYEQLNNRHFNLRRSDALTKIIQSRLNSLTQMALLNFEDTQLVRQAVKIWLNNGRPGVLRALIIQLETGYMSSSPICTGSTRAHWAESMLSPIRVLSLRGMAFAWDSPIYWNLVVLRIGNIHQDAAPTLGDLLGVLSACPLLHTLRLYGMAIRPGEMTTTPESVYLGELVDLNLAVLSPKSVGLLLPRIVTPHKDLSLRMAFPAWDAHAFGVIYPFLARTNVTRLFIEQCSDPEPGNIINQCLAALPDLHTLILDLSLRPGDSCLSGLTNLDESNTRYIPRCLKLHTLYCVTGSVTVEAVQQIVEIHPSIRKLRFSACYIEPFEDELFYWLRPFVKDVKSDSRLDMAALFDWYHIMD